MNSIDVSLLEMMNAREMRVALQRQLIMNYQVPLICFTLNIPGPIKIFEGISELFSEGNHRIIRSLEEQHLPILYQKTTMEKTGCEAFYSVNGKSETIKKWMTAIEDQDRLGRIFDIDVLRIDGTKVSREELGFSPRTCLLCQQPAHSCSRSRSHTVEELVTEIHKIIQEYLEEP